MKSSFSARRAAVALGMSFALLSVARVVAAQGASTTDPRATLRAGWKDAGEASRNLTLVSHSQKPAQFVDTTNLGSFSFLNSDLAFHGNTVVQGNFGGFQIWDISNIRKPVLRSLFPCPGGQGDPSVYGNLLFISVEETRGRVDCGAQGVTDTVSAERFRGVRIFDISSVDHPKQVATVQTCRGSHTHTLVVDPADKANIYVYVSGTAGVRSPRELAGCSGLPPEQDPNTSLYRIDVIKVPLAHPEQARVVSSPRVFADAGHVNGLSQGNKNDTSHVNSVSERCHDITAYSAIGLAAGACAGNGLLMDIKDAANPHRVDAAQDPNFAFWHSATFNNSGTTVIFTDEWGGGTLPKCRATDKLEWGADALFTIKNNKLTPAGYFKMPAAQTETENCVAHNGGLIPVPGRDIMVQGWYQGGLDVFDFTDPSHVREIAYFDRGPMDATKLYLSGFWCGYYYNGHIIGSEIGRGLDIFELKPSDQLSQNEIDAANSVRNETLNPQNQQKVVWPASFPVARSYLDQLVRGNGIAAARSTAIGAALTSAEKAIGAARKTALTTLAGQIDGDAAGAKDAQRVRWLSQAVKDLAAATK
jgi:hypothetical protein